MPQHNSKYSAPSQRDPEFEQSWQQLLASGRDIIGLATTSKQQCRMLLNTREQLSHNHFAQFPVGPENRDRYRQRLSELFRQEQELDRVKSELRDQAPHTNPHLRLVR